MEIIGNFSYRDKKFYVVKINGNAHVMEKDQVDKLRKGGKYENR